MGKGRREAGGMREERRRSEVAARGQASGNSDTSWSHAATPHVGKVERGEKKKGSWRKRTTAVASKERRLATAATLTWRGGWRRRDDLQLDPSGEGGKGEEAAGLWRAAKRLWDRVKGRNMAGLAQTLQARQGFPRWEGWRLELTGRSSTRGCGGNPRRNGKRVQKRDDEEGLC